MDMVLAFRLKSKFKSGCNNNSYFRDECNFIYFNNFNILVEGICD